MSAVAVAAATASATETLGAFVAGLRLEGVPGHVVEKVKCNLLHDLACSLAAHSIGRPVWALVDGLAPGEATLLCTGKRVPAESAAFANAVIMHGRAQDDTHFGAKCHAGSIVVPAVLATAQRTGASGARVIAALVAGYEVATSVGELFADVSTARGFRSSMVYGTLGAAAATASLLGLDAAATADAIGIATSFSGGLNEAWVEGSTEWRWEMGVASRNGITAARLAAEGARGARNAFEGPAGFVRAFVGIDGWEQPADWELGRRWRILDVIYKAHPVCNITQSTVDVAMALARDNDLAPADVAGIKLWLNPVDRVYPGTLNWGPFEDVGATLMSAPYCLAMGFAERGATLAGLRRFDDPEIAHLVGCTEVLPGDDLPVLSARIELRTTDGRTLGGEQVPVPETFDWDWEGISANVERLALEMEDGGATVPALKAALRDLERLDSLEPLLAAVVTR